MREEQRRYIRELYGQIKEAEQQMKDKPIPRLMEKDFYLFHETGNRLVYENAYFGRRKYLTVYAILTLWSRELYEQGITEHHIDLEKEEDYVRHLEEILSEICRERFWALPAHVDFDKVDRPETELTIDLFAAETAQALSEIILRLHDRLSVKVVTSAACEVIRRVVQPFILSDMPYSWWETDRCNWSAVCAGSIGMTAVNVDALRRMMPSDNAVNRLLGQLPADWKESCLNRVCDALGCYLDGMETDGACTEGLGYYNYGMSFYAAFAQMCESDSSLMGGGRQLMYREKCEQIALFQQKCYFRSRFGGGISISFSDGSAHESFLPGLTAYLRYCYPQVQTPDYALARPFDEDACYRYLTNERNISWLVKYASDEADDNIEDAMEGGADHQQEHQQVSRPTANLLPAAQWCICQDENGNGFAAKGGNNDENHNHNDIGHFLCVYNGEMLLTDLGAGEYTKEYFSEKRYDILCNRSLGHSVPIINGEEQCAGKAYCAGMFAWEEEERTLTIEFAGAYRSGDIQKIVRRIRMCGNQDSMENDTESVLPEAQKNEAPKMKIEIQDVFTGNENTRSILENLVTEYKPTVHDGEIVIKGRHGRCCITLLDYGGEMIQIIPCAHKNHAGKIQTIYRIVWGVNGQKCMNTACKMWITFYDN